MTQRTLAAVIALPLVLILVILAWTVPLPYTIYRPGPTENVLAQVKVNPKDHPTFPGTGGEIRMTTVNETLRDTHLGLWALLGAWLDKDAAVYPTSVAYAPDQTQQQDQQQGQQMMVTAQQTAAYVALEQLGFHIFIGAQVEAAPKKGEPAYGKLRKGDIITAVDSTPVRIGNDLATAVHALKPGQPATFTYKRGNATRRVRISPVQQSGLSVVGISVGDATKMPFPVTVNVPQDIGGPSAGLMMALAIYDYLTPGSLTGGQPIAGTGTISDDGAVGPIGGIQQKIPGAMHAGAKLFLVPADNCEDVLNSDHGSMRLARVTTMGSAVRIIKVWAANHNAVLPSCGSTP